MRALARLLAPAAGVLLAPASAAAHGDGPILPHDLWYAWSFEPLVVAGLLVTGALYWKGVARLWRQAGVGAGVRRWQVLCFAGGLLATAIALVSPLDPMGEALFSAHMAQHELLMRVAAPLLVLAAPLPALLWGVPREWRSGAGAVAKRPLVRSVWGALTHPLAAWSVHAIILWAWHAPSLYQATLESDLVHSVQHLSFLGAALLFWWVLVHKGRGGRVAYGVGVLYVFTTAVHESLLGVLLTFGERPWYPAYAGRTEPWGLTPLEDQQLAGLIMWIPGGALYLAAALALFAAWLRAVERDARRAERSRGWSAARTGGLLLLLGASLAGCAGIQSSLDTAGEGAERVETLWWAMFGAGMLLWTVLLGFLFYGTLRARVGPGEREAADARSTRYILAGGGLTAIVLIGVFATSLSVSSASRALEPAEGLSIEVVGHQFWWEVRYVDAAGDTILSANELHLPAGRPIRVDVSAADVIHSFWVPSLHGKIDMLPGRTNSIRVRPERPGVYRGQCAEFCGLQHANMAFMVVVHAPEEFDGWLERERGPAAEPTDPEARRGREVFETTACAACHRIRGTRAAGTLGPDLTHLASRLTLAAATLPNTRGHLGGWLGNPQRIKPGNEMPFVPLPSEDFQALLTYLQGLR